VSPEAYISYVSLSLKQQKRTIMKATKKSTCKSINQGIPAKKEKEKIHVSTDEWRIIMSAINHGTEVPADSRREVLMGYQYALHQHKKKLREERDMFMRSRGDNSTSSGGYWDEYSDASKSSLERHRDPKHNRRTTAQVREESYAKSQSAQQSEEKEDFIQETPEAALVAA
jgi:hypothetical protein